jgi:hypothetical protein
MTTAVKEEKLFEMDFWLQVRLGKSGTVKD